MVPCGRKLYCLSLFVLIVTMEIFVYTTISDMNLSFCFWKCDNYNFKFLNYNVIGHYFMKLLNLRSGF